MCRMQQFLVFFVFLLNQTFQPSTAFGIIIRSNQVCISSSSLLYICYGACVIALKMSAVESFYSVQLTF